MASMRGNTRPLAPVGAEQNHMVESLGRVVPLLLERVGQRLPQWFRRLPGARSRLSVVLGQHAEQATGGRIGDFDEAFRVDDDHRVGK